MRNRIWTWCVLATLSITSTLSAQGLLNSSVRSRPVRSQRPADTQEGTEGRQPPASNRLTPHFMNEYKFTINFAPEPSPELEKYEAVLCVSTDQQRTWRVLTRQLASKQFFDVQVNRDGPYWLATLSPLIPLGSKIRLPEEMRAEQLIVVDQTLPEIRQFHAAVGPRGEINAYWQVFDLNLNPESIELYYQPAPGAPARKLQTGPGKFFGTSLQGQASWPASAPGRNFVIELRVKDRANNVARRFFPPQAAQGRQVAQPSTVQPATPPAPITRAPKVASNNNAGQINAELATGQRPTAPPTRQVEGNQFATNERGGTLGQRPLTAKPVPPRVHQASPSETLTDLPQTPKFSETRTPTNSVYNNTGVVQSAPEPNRAVYNSVASSSPAEQPRTLTPTNDGVGIAPKPTNTQNPNEKPKEIWPSDNASLASSGQAEPYPPTTSSVNPPVAKQVKSTSRYSDTLANADFNKSSAPANSQTNIYTDEPRYQDRQPNIYQNQPASAQTSTGQQQTPEPPTQPNRYQDTGSAASKTTQTSNVAAPAYLPPGERLNLTNSRRFNLDYTVDSVGPSGIEAVQLWATRDGGRSWQQWQQDDDRTSPIRVEAKEDGIFGFRVVVQGKNTPASPTPEPGDLADLWISIDTKAPQAKLTSALHGKDKDAGQLIIRWEAADDNLASHPITLKFSETDRGPWTTIAMGLPNDGEYAWRIDSRMPPKFYLLLEVLDKAGNKSTDQLTDPIASSGLSPKGRINGFRPID